MEDATTYNMICYENTWLKTILLFRRTGTNLQILDLWQFHQLQFYNL
jgi:hypothetical protein